MQDPKFEKQVQQKMEELSFSPSDAVWLKVDAEINRKRKRRGVFFWLLFSCGYLYGYKPVYPFNYR